MLGFPNPAILAAGATGRTYAEWQAHIAARATEGSVNQAGGTGGFEGIYRTTLGPGAGTLYGTPWLSYFYASSSSTVRRVIQHGLPSAAVFNEQVAGAGEVVFQLISIGFQDYFSELSRNGFTSLGGDLGGAPACVCPLVGWWDPATQSALMMNPQAGTGPVPYTAPGW